MIILLLFISRNSKYKRHHLRGFIQIQLQESDFKKREVFHVYYCTIQSQIVLITMCDYLYLCRKINRKCIFHKNSHQIHNITNNVCLAYLAPFQQTLETKLMHARVREALAADLAQTNCTVWRRRTSTITILGRAIVTGVVR